MIAALYCTLLLRDGQEQRGKCSHRCHTCFITLSDNGQIIATKSNWKTLMLRLNSHRYRDLFEAIKDPLLDSIESQGISRPTLLDLQPELRSALNSMEQPDFSAMLLKMTGDPSAAVKGIHQHLGNSMNDSYDIEVMPELAFDFTLPFDTSDISFDPSYF
jgi:hypothetical protein